MPLWAKIYIAFFLLFTVSNIGYYLYLKTKPLVIIYDFFSGIFFMLMMISYWQPIVKHNLNAIVAIIFFTILSFEFYLSTTRAYQKLGVKIPEEMTENDMNIAQTISILFASPAYITGGLSMLELLFSTSSWTFF